MRKPKRESTYRTPSALTTPSTTNPLTSQQWCPQTRQHCRAPPRLSGGRRHRGRWWWQCWRAPCQGQGPSHPGRVEDDERGESRGGAGTGRPTVGGRTPWMAPARPGVCANNACRQVHSILIHYNCPVTPHPHTPPPHSGEMWPSRHVSCRSMEKCVFPLAACVFALSGPNTIPPLTRHPRQRASDVNANTPHNASKAKCNRGHSWSVHTYLGLLRELGAAPPRPQPPPPAAPTALGLARTTATCTYPAPCCCVCRHHPPPALSPQPPQLRPLHGTAAVHQRPRRPHGRVAGPVGDRPGLYLALPTRGASTLWTSCG